MSEFTKEDEDHARQWLDRINDKLNNISLKNHGELMRGEDMIAGCVYWLGMVKHHFPEALGVCDYLSQLVIPHGVPVANDEEAEKIKKNMVN